METLLADAIAPVVTKLLPPGTVFVMVVHQDHNMTMLTNMEGPAYVKQALEEAVAETAKSMGN
jgi:hypothetical protein